MVDRVLVVDAANVVGSRPDGWWRDRAGAAARLLALLTALPGRVVAGPDGPVRVSGVRVVLEGRATAAADPAGVDPSGAGPDGAGLVVARVGHDGDTAVVRAAEQVLAGGGVPLVVTADRGLRARLPEGSDAVGPGWLNAVLGR